MTRGALSAEDRERLLAIARRAIGARLRGEGRPRPAVSDRLREPQAAFVTLTRAVDGELRGCVGWFEAVFPLWETVSRAAEAAATDDGRFDPVTLEELAALHVEVSALTPPRRLKPEEVEVGTHGLVVGRSGRRGLLLPQVPVEHGWDRETFLAQVCRKAGLPADAWRDPRAELLGFEAEVFGEDR